MTKLFHERITEYAMVNPKKAAAADAFGEMSYAELEARSAAVARALWACGVRTGSAVAVYVPYGKTVVLGTVAALRAGGVFIPFDGSYPAKRLEYMREDSDAVLLTTRAFWEERKLDVSAEKVIFMDEISADDDDRPAPICDALEEASPAMMLYTSGTTGQPKGVMHTHKMLLHIVDWMNIHKGAGMNENTRTGVMSNLSFVGSQMFILGPLARGGTVCFAPEAARNDMGYLDRFIREARITHIFIPAALAAAMAEDYDIRNIFVFAAGEKLRNFKPHCPGNTLINSYGSTETSGVLSKPICGDETRILIGKPFSNTKTRILDENLRPVSRGETGELLITNDFMAQGYYKLPELSAEKWKMIDGERWYRTGDQARYAADGDVELLGRTDNMIKLRGFRIETGEVEAQILNAVKQLGRDDLGQIIVTVRTVCGTERLCCYYEAPRTLDRKAVMKEAAAYLAEYMIPEVWVRLDNLPRNPNGKVMRSELPQPERESGGHIGGALDSEVLARLVYTAAEMLDTTELIGPDDRFTDLGGTSLTAMKYVVRLREQGIKVTSAQVLQLNVFRRIAEAAEVAYEQLWLPEEYERVRRDFADRNEHIQKVLPITPAQDEMLFDQIIHPDRCDDRDVAFLQTDSCVSEDDLREALDIVSDENEVLRSAIVFRHVTTVQQVITDRRIPLETIDAGKLESGGLVRLRDSFLHAPMDLQRDSVVRVVNLRAGGTFMLCVMIHRAALNEMQRRACLARLMSILEEKYPNDQAISGWREIFEANLPEIRKKKLNDRCGSKETGIKREIPPDMCVYSENDGPKVVFVHTANTGSAAYYRLAARIGAQVSFSVIEPYNLYHVDTAVYGIKNIAAHYIEILKRHQPQGPYILGGWCYGGMIAHEMACQLEQAGEDVRLLVMLDSHAITTGELREISSGMTAEVNRTYFETSPLFADLRESGMLEAMVANAEHSTADMVNHMPSFYQGDVLYFKPDQLPSGISPESSRFWEKMMEFNAGNYEHYCRRDRMRIVHTPHEHDLMMDDASLDIIVPELMKAIESQHGEGKKD